MTPLMSTMVGAQSVCECRDHRDERLGYISRSQLCVARRRIASAAFWEAWCSGALVPSGFHAQAAGEAIARGEPYLYATPPHGWTLACTRCGRVSTGRDGWRLLDRYFRSHHCDET